MLKAAVLAMAAFLVSGSASAEWITMRSPNFVYVGDASESDIRSVARRLEQFREAMLQSLPKATTTSQVPTVVIVFRSVSSFRPYMPVRDGQVVEVGGYFISGPDLNYIGVTLGAPEPYGAIFHEYTHFLNQHTVGDALWLSEGLASVYETLQLFGGGRGAVIGTPDRADLRILYAERLMPLAQLIAVERSSPLYGGDERRGLFYAQSWALTHYLTVGNKARQSQFEDYLARLGTGEGAATAFASAFGDIATLERELEGYVRRGSFAAQRVEFAARITGAEAGPAEKLADHEGQAYLGDLLARTDRQEAARLHLQRILTARPDAVRAAAVLGMQELRAANVDAAIPLLERAVRAMPGEALYQAALGRAFYRRSREGGLQGNALAAARARAHEALTASWTLHPLDAEVAAILADLTGDPEKAAGWMGHAVALDPSQDYYRLMLANLLTRVGDHQRASELLGPLVERGSTAEIRAEARIIAERVAEIRRMLTGQ